MKPLLLRLHRWITLAFAVPLLVVIVTGLILSFEPIVQTAAITPGTVTLAQVEALIAKADPGGKATGLALRPWENSLVVGGGGRGGQALDLTTGAPAETGTLTALMGASRGIHERLLYDLGWLVTASTVALLVLIVLGVLMGLPRIRNTVAGWHKATAWFLLPLIVLSPLSGLALALGITLATPTPRPAGAPVTMLEAVRTVAAGHDLAALNSIRQRGSTMLARIWEGGELKAYGVGRDGLVAVPRNWPRLIHEGNGAGVWTGLANVVTSVAFVGLLGTGLFIWARRTFRRRPAGRRVAVTG